MASGIIIEVYNPEWPETFRLLAGVIHKELDGWISGIEHVGSTSVPGLSAKPIIDMDIIIEGTEQLGQVIDRLDQLGYFHQGNLGIEGREAFGRNSEHTPIDGKSSVWMNHHLYVCAKDGRELKRHLAFRDFLRNDPKAAAEYDQFKKELAKSAKDREMYTEEKSGFINDVLSKA